MTETRPFGPVAKKGRKKVPRKPGAQPDAPKIPDAVLAYREGSCGTCVFFSASESRRTLNGVCRRFPAEVQRAAKSVCGEYANG